MANPFTNGPATVIGRNAQVFYLLIAIIPQNCLQTHNLWLYAAVVFYWVMILTPRAALPEIRETE